MWCDVTDALVHFDASPGDLTDYAALLGFDRNPSKGERMSDYRDTEELSGWDVAYSAAYAEEQEKRGLFGLSAEEIPPEMDKEIHKAVIEQVGERPDPGD